MSVVTVRRRSSWFLEANRQVRCIRDLGLLKREDFKNIGVLFGRWLEEYSNGKVAVLVKDQEYCFIRLLCRFQKAYKHWLYGRLKVLSNVNFRHHLILEVDPHQFLNFASEFDWINRSWAKLRSWLFKKYCIDYRIDEKGRKRLQYVVGSDGKRHIKVKYKLDFVRVLEPHKSLRPHLHVLISGIPFIKFEELASEWKDRLKCGFVFRKTVRSGFNALWYVLKYVCKMVVGGKKFDSLFSAVFFATNKRLFTVSRGILPKARVVKEKAGFSYLGVRALALLEAYCKEKALKFSMVLKVSPKSEDLYGHFELFFIDDGG